MIGIFKDSTVRVWLLLTGLTLFSWILAAGQTAYHAEDTTQEYATIGLILVAFYKVRLVILEFMEIRTAPMALRAMCEVWVVLVCAVLIFLTVFGAPFS